MECDFVILTWKVTQTHHLCSEIVQNMIILILLDVHSGFAFSQMIKACLFSATVLDDVYHVYCLNLANTMFNITTCNIC